MTLDDKIKAFLSVNFGYGSGDGDGYGYGSGSGRTGFLRMAKRCARQWRRCETSFLRICRKMNALTRFCEKQTARKHIRHSIFTAGITD